MNLVRPPWWLRALLDPQALWRMSPGQPTVYLTFDDGPHPEITPFVLEQLAAWNARATFFCIGENVRKYPEVYASILAAGHAVGNHTAHHLNGWKVSTGRYLADVAECARVVDSKLFRPPYGKAGRAKAAALRKMGYAVVLWDVLTWDFRESLDPGTCLQLAIRNTRPGSIIVFHDSEKAFPRLQAALPGLLKHIAQSGWTMSAIPNPASDVH